MTIDTGLYDSDTGEDLPAIEVVDVSAHQNHSRNASLIFMKARRGRIAQLQSDGARIHYFFDEPGGRKMMDEDSERFGFAPGQLLALAVSFAPSL